MRLIYKRSIVDRLRDLVDAAHTHGREIECIVVSEREYREYRELICHTAMPQAIRGFKRHDGGTYFDGYPVLRESEAAQVEDLQRRGWL